ncbi:MAG: hypothetical protein J2P34_09980, partial [Actinobacteria bacterium]|nr:hypothetical protein [Actinomycetota bacterium]
LLFAPLLAARVAVLRRPRDHAVTAGWAAGLLVQAVPLIGASALHQSQSRVNQPGPVHDALGFYTQGVVQSALGWHIGWWLRSAAGPDGAALIVGVALAALFGWALAAGPAAPRMFIAAALATGFVFTVVSSDLGCGWARIWSQPSVRQGLGSRYATLALFLIDCAAIVAIDALQRRRPAPHAPAWRRIAPVLALVAVLSAGWATDFRFDTVRAQAPPWAPRLASWRHQCAADPAGAVRVKAFGGQTTAIPCARIRD